MLRPAHLTENLAVGDIELPGASRAGLDDLQAATHVKE
jgi:hypothetical protein